MMENVPDWIQRASQRLKEGHRVNRITVRELLNHFGAARRGAVKAEAIRTILDSLGIVTEPDFQAAWIDEPIWLRLKDGVPPFPRPTTESERAKFDLTSTESDEAIAEDASEAAKQAIEQADAAPTSAQPDVAVAAPDSENSDPTFRIGNFPAAHKTLVSVNSSASVLEAITLMLAHDFSQLPVMHGEREVKGVVSWKSIGSRKVRGRKCDCVGECCEDARIVNANGTLFDAIPVIVEYDYVLVREHDKRITGIVTASDLSLQFQSLAEPFLLLREIELHLRGLLKDELASVNFGFMEGVPPKKQKQENIADLTFGEYVLMLQQPAIWEKLNLTVDKGVLTKLLEEVRVIRNDVMHFDPDPMTFDELATLKRAVRLMQEVGQPAP